MMGPSRIRKVVFGLHLIIICGIQGGCFAFRASHFCNRYRYRSYLGNNAPDASSVRDGSSVPTGREHRRVLEEKDPSALTFSGEVIKNSKPLARKEDRNRFIDFFSSPSARDLLFVSDSTPKPVDPIPKDVFDEWKREAESLGATTPQYDSDVVFELSSDAISFSGLSVQTTVYCGAKLVSDRSSENSYPFYEFTMIKDMTEASGPKFLMWIYNQVMDFAARNSNKKDKTTRSLCIVTPEETDGGISLCFESFFQSKMKFPWFLIKILPVSKERAEKQGSSAVRNFVEKGVTASLDRFENAFKQY